MRQYDIIIKADRFSNEFRYKTDKDGFRRMRAFIFQAQNGMTDTLDYKLADLCDDIRDLEVGEEIYAISAEWEVYKANSLENLNKTIAMMERMSRSEDMAEYGAHYMPNQHKAFSVKRTPKQWIVTTYFSDIA